MVASSISSLWKTSGPSRRHRGDGVATRPRLHETVVVIPRESTWSSGRRRRDAPSPRRPPVARPSLPSQVLSCSGGWKLFNGNAEHYTKPYQGTRISFIAFSHNAYNKLSTRVASKLKELGFTAASDDGVDLPYFAKYRIDKSEFTPDENSKSSARRLPSRPPAGAVAATAAPAGTSPTRRSAPSSCRPPPSPTASRSSATA